MMMRWYVNANLLHFMAVLSIKQLTFQISFFCNKEFQYKIMNQNNKFRTGSLHYPDTYLQLPLYKHYSQTNSRSQSHADLKNNSKIQSIVMKNEKLHQIESKMSNSNQQFRKANFSYGYSKQYKYVPNMKGDPESSKFNSGRSGKGTDSDSIHMQSIIKELREENQQLKTQRDNQSSQISLLKSQNTTLRMKQRLHKTEVEHLNSKIQELNQKLSSCKATVPKDVYNYRDLGESFQKKINGLIQENYSLRNTISGLQNRIKELQNLNNSYKLTVQAYQKRDNQAEQPVLKKEMDDLRAKLERLEEQHENKISFYQLEVAKLSNAISEGKLENSKHSKHLEAFHQQFKKQMEEVELLRRANN